MEGNAYDEKFKGSGNDNYHHNALNWMQGLKSIRTKNIAASSEGTDSARVNAVVLIE